MKRLEIGLTEPQFALLREANAHDKTFRSLESFARDALMAGLTQIAARDCSQRAKAVALLIGAASSNTRRGKQ
jgi:hypothetical protein